MAKKRSSYICSNCGKRSAGFFRICPQCGEFGTMSESAEAEPRRSPPRASIEPQPLAQIDRRRESRIAVPIAEFSRVLGGGIVPGSLVLLGGEPGIGKSTLALQLSAQLAQAGADVLYISGEESARQIKLRADRLDVGGDRLFIMTETELESVFAQVERLQPTLLAIDSIQTLRSAELAASPGLVAQVRECAGKLQNLAKRSGVSILLIGHVTKEGGIAGPRVLEHIVDVVLYLEGDPFQHYRLLRGVKNRFGATSEIGVFEMRDRGLVEVANPSAVFLEERAISASGSAIAVSMEGTRPLLVELQALTSPSAFGNPRRTPNGVDLNRLLLISAVLSKRLGLKLWEQDIFVNVVGGLRIRETAADLAMALAIASSYHDRALPADLAIVGEVGLSGEIRRVGQLEARLNEARKIGFKRALVPRLRRGAAPIRAGMELIQARNLAEAIDAAIKLD